MICRIHRAFVAVLVSGFTLFAPFEVVGQDDGLVAAWSFDEGAGRFTEEHVSGTNTTVLSNYHSVEWAEGAVGKALRLDGYSVYLAKSVAALNEPMDELTVEAWVALEAYPVANAPFLNQYTYPGKGFFFGMDRWGRWYLAASVNGEWYTAWGTDAFPKNRWAHVAGTYKRGEGLKVYLDGALAGAAVTPNAPITPEPSQSLTIGRDVHTSHVAGIFPTGMLGGLIDEVRVYDHARTGSQIRESFTAVSPPTDPDLAVPPSRFADDHHRPAYHPIPAANWTNEPHGLVRHDGRYHLFYQKNPNGPYWEQIHWGHLSSVDLVDWRHEPIALAPAPGYDERGIWSGDAVVHDGKLVAVYTCVDYVRAGVCLATQRDDGSFEKHPANPVIASPPGGFMDFRDPFLWEEAGLWHLIIGSGIQNLGGTAIYYTSPDLVSWTYKGRILTGSRSTSGIYWEMPVFVPIGAGKHALFVTTVEDRAPARGLYWIGEWDGSRFTPDDPAPQQQDLINHMLSPSMAFTPEGEIRAVGIIPEMRSSQRQLEAGWAHTFNLPRDVRLCADGGLCQTPAPELAKLRTSSTSKTNVRIRAGTTGHLSGIRGRQLELRAVIDPGEARSVGMRLYRSDDGAEETRLYYDVPSGTLNLDLSASTKSSGVSTPVRGAQVPLREDGTLLLHVFVDHSVLEVFVNERHAFATRVYPTHPSSDGLDFYSSGGEAVVDSVAVWTLRGSTSVSAHFAPDLPAEFSLGQNYPNPFNPQTVIEFATTQPGFGRLVVYDTLGREVVRLVEGEIRAGSYRVRWEGVDARGASVPSGVYFYRLALGDHSMSRKMVLIR
jgi:sucrose-6-phosphate hydrolase SacC (GH32 family)